LISIILLVVIDIDYFAGHLSINHNHLVSSHHMILW
jgi:hypothetical protein